MRERSDNTSYHEQTLYHGASSRSGSTKSSCKKFRATLRLKYTAISSSTVSIRCGKSVRSWCDGSSDRSFMVDTLSYFSFQPVFHDWWYKGRGMCKLICGMVNIKEPLLLFGKSSPCGGSGFPLSLSEWSFTI